MHKDEMGIDTYIRKRIQGFQTDGNHFEPSKHFTHNVMARITKLEKRRKIFSSIKLAAVGMSPFMAQELWLTIRNDYFSASSFPLSNLVVKTYGVFVSPMATYVLLATGLAACIYLIKTRRDKNYSGLGNLPIKTV